MLQRTLRTQLLARHWLLCCLCIAACDDAESTKPTADSGVRDAGADASALDGAAPDGAAPDGGLASTCIDARDPFTWPVPNKPQAVPKHATWKSKLTWPDDAFLWVPETYNPDDIRWVKFTVLLSDPTRVYFQDSTAYPFHYDFATERIPAFRGMSRAEFDAVTLKSEGQRAVLGAVLVPVSSQSSAEYGIQLVLGEEVHPELVKTLYETVAKNVEAPEGTRGFYMPSPALAQCASENDAYYAQHDISVGSVDRWLSGDACYAQGWAIGKVVKLAADDVDDAYLDGRLEPDDILLLSDGAPAELPYVRGVLTLAASTPNSHAAILARSYGVPFAYLRTAEAAASAEQLVGKQVVVSTRHSFLLNACQVRFVDVNALSPALRAEIRALADEPPLDLAAIRKSGKLSLAIRGLGPADIDRVGGKAANFGLLEAALPEQVPTPAIALTFDLWTAFMAQPAPGGAQGTLGDEIARRLAPYAWPPDFTALDATLDGVRELVRDASFPAALATNLRTALAPFDPKRNIRFRSSTNVEDSESFTGAGLYDSASGCLLDDTDDDDLGPSRCDPSEKDERGVYRAVQKVFASFYRRNALLERLRRGVPESQVGMALLVHHSVPDETELANGVATLTRNSPENDMIELVTQLGAVSVANPDGSARAEVVRLSRYDTFVETQTVEESSLVVLGEHVLTWKDDYLELQRLFGLVASRYTQVTGKAAPIALDFEYKKVDPGVLSIKQVRPLPLPDTTRDVTPFLVGAPTTLCVFQGESSDVFAIHHLKSKLVLDGKDVWLRPSALSSTYYEDVVFDYVTGGAVEKLRGDPGSFSGAAHTVGEGEVSDAWTVSGAQYTLSSRLETTVARSEAPVLTFADASFTLSAEWPEPIPYVDWFEGALTRTSESALLTTQCPDEATLRPGGYRVDKTYDGPNDLRIVTSYWFPAPPRGITAGYTAPLVKWESTTITGLTSTPIVMRGYYAQTFRPFHHNFGADYIFEPRLEPDIAQSVLDELAADDIAYVHVRAPLDEPPTFWLAGLDGSLRELKAD